MTERMDRRFAALAKEGRAALVTFTMAGDPDYAAAVADKGTHQICPYAAGGTNFWPSSYSRRTGLLYLPTHEGCGRVTTDTSAHVLSGLAAGERIVVRGGVLLND